MKENKQCARAGCMNTAVFSVYVQGAYVGMFCAKCADELRQYMQTILVPLDLGVEGLRRWWNEKR